MSNERVNCNWWKTAQMGMPAQQPGGMGMGMGMASGNGAPKAVASNPANEINNIPMSGDGAADEGLDSDEVKKLLKSIVTSGTQITLEDRQALESMLGKATDPEWNARLDRLLKAMSANSDPHKLTRDPETGKPDKMPHELAKEYLKVLEAMPNESNTQEHHQQQQQQPLAYASARRISNIVPGHNDEEHGPHKKKKTRGNPFRVLMGKVGKLLDHGVDKHDIIRQLNKDMDFFSTETISKAVDVVKSYNKKKHKNDQLDVQEERDVIHGKETIGEGDMPLRPGEELLTGKSRRPSHPHETIKHVRPIVQEQRMNISPMMPSPMFASTQDKTMRIAQEIPQPGKGTRGGENIYDYEPDWSKRSTSELYTWLHTLTSTSKSDYKRGDAFPTLVSVKGSATRLSAIRKELKARGWSESEQDEWIKKQEAEG